MHCNKKQKREKSQDVQYKNGDISHRTAFLLAYERRQSQRYIPTRLCPRRAKYRGRERNTSKYGWRRLRRLLPDVAMTLPARMYSVGMVETDKRPCVPVHYVMIYTAAGEGVACTEGEATNKSSRRLVSPSSRPPIGIGILAVMWRQDC